MKRALFIGRFQPPHKGHILVIKDILEEYDEVIVAIGSSQESHTYENPFTAGERVLMIREALREAGIDLSRVYIIPVPDIKMNYVWPRYVALHVPPFEVVISGNPLVKRLFIEAGFKVVTPKMYNRELYSGKLIRKLLHDKNDKWKELVPPSIVKIIESIDGVNRMVECTSSDEYD